MINLHNKTNWLTLSKNLRKDCSNILDVDLSLGAVHLLGTAVGEEFSLNLYDLILELDQPLQSTFTSELTRTNKVFDFLVSSDDRAIPRHWLRLRTTYLRESRNSHKILAICDDRTIEAK